MSHTIEINVHEDRAQYYYTDLRNFKNQLKEQRKMLKDSYENDADYHDKLTEIKEKKKELKAIQQQLENNSSVKVIKQKIKDLKVEVQDVQEGLFSHLDMYSTQMKTNTIEIEGEVMTIKKSFRLTKRS